MKLLVLAPQNVNPPTDGGKASTFYPLRAFARCHEVHFAFPAPVAGPAPEALVAEYADLGIQAVPLPPIPREGPRLWVANALQSLPFKIRKYNGRAGRDRLRALVEAHGIRVVWVNMLHLMPTALELKARFGCSVILREQNFEADLVGQYARLHPSPVHRMVARWQQRKTIRYERQAWSGADEVLFISDSDCALARENGAPLASTDPLYDIVPVAAEPPGVRPEGPPLRFVYPLRFSSVQNLFSARRFFREIWEPFVTRYPTSELVVTGSSPPDLAGEFGMSPARQSDLRIQALGFVEDYLGLLREHRYFLSPTYLGSGVRIKLMEAMAQGCLCLCTELDLRSIRHYRDGENIVSFRDVGDFEQKVSSLERAAPWRASIRRSAWELARELFSEAAYVSTAEAVLARIGSEAGRP